MFIFTTCREWTPASIDFIRGRGRGGAKRKGADFKVESAKAWSAIGAKCEDTEHESTEREVFLMWAQTVRL